MSLLRRHGAFSLIARLATLVLVAAGLTMAATVTTAHAAVQKAVSTTTNIGYSESPGNGACLNGPSGGDPVNCNLYTAKEDVWLSNLPDDLPDGEYFLAVLKPGGQNDPNDGSADLLSTDSRAERTFRLDNGVLSTTGTTGTHVVFNDRAQLAPYADTPNPGGVYILAVCSTADEVVDPSSCKYDAFKVVGDEPPTDPGDEFADPLTVTKDADGAFDNTYSWTIDKDVDKTLVKQVGGSATFNYTVTVGHDSGTVSNTTVTGTIAVHNPNDAEVSGVDITDTLSNGTECTVTGGEDATVAASVDSYFDYSCDLSGLPEGSLDNTVTVTWDEQVLSDDKILEGDAADFTFEGVSFAENAIDDCVNVKDSFNGATPVAIGSNPVCVGDDNPTEIDYSKTITIPSYGCVSYDNTASFRTNSSYTTDSDSATVTVCGPARTGALTMGFWQNKNGQAIITGGSYTPTGSPSVKVCNSGTWLRQLAPFQDLSATATCAQVGTYVTNVIKKANASGAAMNAMLKGQMLATSLDVYFSSAALGGNKINAPAPIGGQAIDLTKVCKNIATCTVYENTSSAFGGATSLTVSQLLAYAASQSNSGGGTWYGQVKATQELAKDTFDAINNEKAFGA